MLISDAAAIYNYISRIEASNFNKTDIVNSIDKLLKQNVAVNKKPNSGYNSFFPYNDNLVSGIPQMESASNPTTPIITREEPNSVNPISQTLP